MKNILTLPTELHTAATTVYNERKINTWAYYLLLTVCGWFGAHWFYSATKSVDNKLLCIIGGVVQIILLILATTQTFVTLNGLILLATFSLGWYFIRGENEKIALHVVNEIKTKGE